MRGWGGSLVLIAEAKLRRRNELPITRSGVRSIMHHRTYHAYPSALHAPHPRPLTSTPHRLSPAGDNRIEFDEFEQAFLIFAQDQNKDDSDDNDEGNSAGGAAEGAAAAGRAVAGGGAGGAREAAVGRSVAVDGDWENIATPPLTPAAREGEAGGKGGGTDGITDDITTIFMEERKGLIARITALEEDKAALGAEKEALAEDVRTHSVIRRGARIGMTVMMRERDEGKRREKET